MTDPFEVLSTPVEPQTPRPAFARALRAELAEVLGLDPMDAVPTVDLPQRSRTMSTTTIPARATTGAPTVLVPYLAISGAARALDWYGETFGAVEEMRVVGDDGRIGHAEITIGEARMMLADEYPEYDVLSPQTLGGSPTLLHLTVPDVDALFARAVEAGATAVSEPADQAHGNRHGTLVDPFGHRWMLSQVLEDLDVATYAERAQGSGFEVVGTQPGHTVVAADRPGSGGGIWAAVYYQDALAGIRQLIDVFGFEEQIVVVGDDGTTVHHSQLRWPEGGVVQVGTYIPENTYAIEPGVQGLYVVTADPQAVWERCQQAGLEVIQEPSSPDYDPEGMGFGVLDREGNKWSFGTYGKDMTS
ncbi:MAG: VOC family protein [Actinomycetota bacterium]|nr:VOC family protein [Actinomycetota bacterium]